MKVCINGSGHMTKMAAMAINSKNLLKNLFLQNQKTYDFETWHEASGNGALQCIIHYPGMTLTFLQQGQLRPPMHLNGKK